MQRSASVESGDGGARPPTLLVLFGGVFLGALDIAIVGPALPAIQNQLALDSRQVAWIFSVYILFSLIGAPLLASLSDRIGRRRVYVGCLLSFGIGSIVVASSASIDLLLFGRAIQAIGAGGTLPVASAVIADTFPVERRGRALGLIGAVFGMAFVIGPVAGGIFLQWSWRWLFLVNIPLIIVLVGASIRLLEDRPSGSAGRFDLPGAILLGAGVALLAWGAVSIDSEPGSLAGIGLQSLLALAAAVGLLVLFWLAERQAETPIVQPALLGSRQMRIICVLGFATGLVEASMVFLPSLAVSALSVPPNRASFMLLPLVVALIVGSIVAGRVLDRIGARPVIQAGMGFTIIGLLLFSWLPLGTISFYVAGVTIGFGLSSLLGAPLRFAALEEGGKSGRGASQGLLTVCLSVGRLFGASMTGGIAAGAAVSTAGYQSAMTIIAEAGLVALAFSFWLRRR